jgi:hypothetical protein
MTQRLEPLAVYDTADAAELVGVSNEFLVALIGKAVKQGIIKLQPGWKVRGCDISRLGKVYHSQFEHAQHDAAIQRIRQRDADELRERLERGA